MLSVRWMSFSRSSSNGRLPGYEFSSVICSTSGGLSQGCRWAPISQAPERCKSRMNSKASGVLLTGKSRTKVGRTSYLSKIRCARSWYLTEVTPLARRRPRGRPVELGFGIDHDDQHRRLLGRPVDRSPVIRVEHASTVWFDSWRLLRLR